MNFIAALLSTVLLVCAAFVSAGKVEDHEIPSVERLSYEVAFVGRPFVYAISNLGGSEVAKVIAMRQDELPRWLSYDPGKALLVGVPLWRDKGDLYLDFQSVKDSFKIKVKDLRDAVHQQPFPSLNRTKISAYSQPKCPKGLPVAAATIVFDLNMVRLDGEARVRLLKKVSEFVNVNVRNIHMSAGKGHTTAFGLKDVIMVTAGPGNVGDSKEPGVVVSWQIGCGIDVAGARVASFLKSRTETGALGLALNTPVSEWHITIGYPKEPRIGTRRQAAQFKAPKASRRLTKRNIIVPTRAIQVTPTPTMTAALPSSVIIRATITLTRTTSVLPTTPAIPFKTPVEQFATTTEATTTQEPSTISTTVFPSTTEEITSPPEETTTQSPTTTEELPTTPLATGTESSSTPPPSTTEEETTTASLSTTEEVTTPRSSTTEEITTTPPPSTTKVVTTTPPPSTTEEITTPPPSTTEELTKTSSPSTTEEATTTPTLSTTEKVATTPKASTAEVTTTRPHDERSTIPPTVTTGATKQPVTKTTTVAENKEPEIKNQIDRLNVYEGQGLWYSIPKDTFYDNEDLYTPNLTLSLRTIGWKSTPQWIELDPKSQVIYALPLHEKTIALHEFVLIAADKEGLQAYDAFEVNVMEDTALYNHQFTVEIDYDHTAFSKNLTARLLLLDKIAKYFSVNMSNIRVVSYRSGSVLFTFQFDFVAYDDCYFPLRKEFLSDERVNPRFTKALLPEFRVTGGKFDGLGPCSDVTGPDVGAVGTRPSGAWETYAIVPAIVLAVVLFIIGGCVLLIMRCRRRQTLSEDDKHTFIYKRKPAVLQEEYEVKEHLLKQPLVLPNEKPPLSPQSPRNPSIGHPTNGPELGPGYQQPSFTSSRLPGNQVSPGGNTSRKPGYSGYRLPPAYVPP